MGKKGAGRVRIKQVGPKNPPINPLQEFMNPNNIDNDELSSLIPPPKYDSSITHCYPLSQSFTMNYKKFACIWPTYLDSEKTMKEGRRIKKEDGVECPTVQDISEVLQSFNVRHVIQPYKGYSRDEESRWYNLGRVLYDLDEMRERVGNNYGGLGIMEISTNNSDGIDIDDIPEMTNDNDDEAMAATEGNLTQKQCWKLIASKVEKMPGRIARKIEKKKCLEEEARKEKARKIAAAKNSKASKKATGGIGGSSKKKGKKK